MCVWFCPRDDEEPRLKSTRLGAGGDEREADCGGGESYHTGESGAAHVRAGHTHLLLLLHVK